jgi:hypothetical protein
MTKLEMETHHAQYCDLISKASVAQQSGLYPEAIELALTCWDNIDGMLQYSRKYTNHEPRQLDCLNIVLKCAPYVFDSKRLDALESLLKTQRRILKNLVGALTDALAEARSLMWAAHRLWEQLDREVSHDQTRSAVTAVGRQAGQILDVWKRLGIIRQGPNGDIHQLTTNIGAILRGKCPACGAIVKAKMLKLLENVVCPRCKAKSLFVLLSRDPAHIK